MIRHQLDQALTDAVSRATGTVNEEPSLTLQGPAAEADLNNIVKTYGGPGAFPKPPQVMDPAYYGEVSDVTSLQSALDVIRESRARFDALPARLRAEFDNSPAVLWEFLQSPENLDEAVKLGLLVRRPEEKPQEAAKSDGTPSPS